jgi:acetyl-CoA carboxylase biotin carboxyl carrier protein
MADSDFIDARLVRELADILSDTGLTEIEVERGDLKVRVARTLTAAPAQTQTFAMPPPPAAIAAATPGAPAPPTAEPAGEPVKSPMVGTVYLQAKPGDAPFVTPGARVSAGQTLLIIEAMKTMNPVPAPRDGVVASIAVGDGQPVEYGEPLIVLE